MHVLTLIADRKAAPLTGELVGRVRDAIGGSITIDVLSRGEALDLTVHTAPDLEAVRTALDGAPVDAIAQRLEGRRKRLLIADMD
jgi:phosphoserine phosphatase